MEFKEKLVEMLSNIIRDKMNSLDIAKDNIDKSNKMKEVEDLLNEANILTVDNDKLRDILSYVTDDETIDNIISNIDMIKIVINGVNDGLDLSLDDSQLALINGVYELVNNYRVGLDNDNVETKRKLEEFITNCNSLSDEISSGVIKDIDTLNLIFEESDVKIDDIVNIKFDILRNNNNNYNLHLDGKVKEEVDLRIMLESIGFNLDDFNAIEKKLLLDYGNVDDISNFISYIHDNSISLDKSNLLYLLVFSNVSLFASVLDICEKNGLEYGNLFKIPGVFVSIDSKESCHNILNELKNDDEYTTISYLENIGSYYEYFVKNVSLLCDNGYNVLECFNNNILMFIIPDMEKNITIVSDMNLNVKDFSVVVINPYLATSKSSFKECGLGDYLSNNPMRLTTSYFRLKHIASNIVNAKKNGGVIFRSLSDKKNYWLSRDITRDSKEVF